MCISLKIMKRFVEKENGEGTGELNFPVSRRLTPASFIGGLRHFRLCC